MVESCWISGMLA